MPIEGIIEEDEEGDLVIVLREKKESMTEREKQDWFRSSGYERNICPDYDTDPPPKTPKKRLDNIS